jgi:hypothetical protein
MSGRKFPWPVWARCDGRAGREGVLTFIPSSAPAYIFGRPVPDAINNRLSPNPICSAHANRAVSGGLHPAAVFMLPGTRS